MHTSTIHNHLDCSFVVDRPGDPDFFQTTLSASWTGDTTLPATVLVESTSDGKNKNAIMWTLTKGICCRPTADARRFLERHPKHADAIMEAVRALAKNLMRLNGIV